MTSISRYFLEEPTWFKKPFKRWHLYIIAFEYLAVGVLFGLLAHLRLS